MYQQLGYIVYRTVLEYYSGDPDEDAYGETTWIFQFPSCFSWMMNFLMQYFNMLADMRKALSKDVKKKSVVPLAHPVRPEEVD